MPSFCTEIIAVPARLRANHGVLQADSLAVAHDARRAAALMLQEARAQADAVLEQATAQAADLLRDEQSRVAREAALLLDGLRAARERLLDGVAPLAADLAAQAFERLVLDLTPPERIAAAVRRVREEAPARLVSGLAWVHPDDAPLLADSPWELRLDARLARGNCRLEAASGEWLAGFELGATALKDALLAGAAAARLEES